MAHIFANIACHDCAKILPKDEMLVHVQKMHRQILSCLFCAYGTDTYDSIHIHMCEKHPEKQLVVALRVTQDFDEVHILLLYHVQY